MKYYPFSLILNSPVKSLGYLLDGNTLESQEKRLLIPAEAIRYAMRRQLRDLAFRQKLDPVSESDLFGEISIHKRVQKASAFSISSLIAQHALDVGNVNLLSSDGGYFRRCALIPQGYIFSGQLSLHVADNSAEGIAILMSLIGVQQIGGEQSLGYGHCSVSIDTSDIDLNQIYHLDSGILDVNTKIRASREWLFPTRQGLISYFAKHPEKMREIPPRAFERLVAELFRSQGFDVELTPESNDGGYDIIAVRHEKITGNETYLVECKRYAEKQKVGVEIVRRLMGIVQMKNATKGILITTAKFSRPAHQLVAQHSTRLMLHDYKSLQAWLSAVAK